MEENRIPDEQPEELPEEELLPQQEHYHPRPWWQVALAWVLLVIMLFAVFSYYYNIMRRW